VSWLSVTILSLERVTCLYHPYFYTRKANERNITKVVILCICLTLCIKLSARYLFIPAIKQNKFDFLHATEDGLLNVYFLAVCIFINTACYIAIFLVVKRQMNAVGSLRTTGNQSTSRRHFVSTRNIACIIAVFQLVHVPLLISLCVLAFKENGASNTNLTAICMLIMCAVNPVLYAWRFKECRYTMLRFVGKFCNVFDNRIEAMRIEVYNIT
jgi:hypothetical protein